MIGRGGKRPPERIMRRHGVSGARRFNPNASHARRPSLRACVGPGLRAGTWRGVLLAMVLATLVPGRTFADVRILASPGGEVGPFLRLFEQVRASGERVVIDGPCLSACTLVLSIVPRDRICVTRRAVLGFHAARSIDRRGRIYPEPEATRLVLETYPPPVRKWIRRHGGLTSRLLLLRGRQLDA